MNPETTVSIVDITIRNPHELRVHALVGGKSIHEYEYVINPGSTATTAIDALFSLLATEIQHDLDEALAASEDRAN